MKRLPLFIEIAFWLIFAGVIYSITDNSEKFIQAFKNSVLFDFRYAIILVGVLLLFYFRTRTLPIDYIFSKRKRKAANDNTEDDLLKEINAALKKYDRRKDTHRLISILITSGSAVLGALITVILGWRPTIEIKENFVLVCGATITVLHTFDSFFGFTRHWVLYKTTCTELKSLKREMKSCKPDDLVARKSNYRALFEDIIRESSEDELELRTQSGEATSRKS
jgi:hypothetical protein